MKILQQADNIYIEEIRKANLYDQISQAFAVLLPVKAVGVMGDARTYEQVRLQLVMRLFTHRLFHYSYVAVTFFSWAHQGHRFTSSPVRGFYDG